MTGKTRFDLEEGIMKCWNITDDLKILLEQYLDGDKPMTEDEVANILVGMIELYEIKFDHTFKIFEELVRDKKL